MTKIKNTNAYPFDITISDLDYVIGSDGDNLGKITRNYNIGDLRRYINSGLSPEVGGTLKVSEITYNGVLTSPSEVANALDPNYQVLQYHIVVFSVNGNKYILKEQDITLGLSGTAVTDEDFILIIGFTKLGDGTNVLKGYNTSTELHEFYSIKKDGNLLNLTESLGNIILSIDETELSTFIKDNGKTYSVLNIGTGAGLYKDTTVSGDNTQFNFKKVNAENLGNGQSFLNTIQENTNDITVKIKTLVSNNLTITATDDEVIIETPSTASIPALYVNNLYEPSYSEWLAENKAQNGGTAVLGFIFRGKGTLAQPFTDSIVYPLAGGSATITADTAIQNALDAYVGTETRLSPELSRQKIIIQDNTGIYNFAGDFGYSNLYVKIEGNVLSTTTGYVINADNVLHFNNVDRVTIEILSGALFQIQGLGFNNSGSTIATSNFVNTKTINLLGEGYIFTDTNDINKYVINSDISETGNNNDGGLTFYIRCKIRAVYQGVYKIGGVSRIDFYNVLQSGGLGVAVNTSLKAFNQIGGQVRVFNTATVIFQGVARDNAFTFEPSITYSTTLLCIGNSFEGVATTMFNKLNDKACSFSVVNSQSSSTVTNVFDSTNLWTLNFRENTFTSGVIDFTKVDLTQGNNISSINTIGNNIIQSLRVYASKAAAKTAGLSVNSIFLKRLTVNAVDLIAGLEYKVATSGSPSLGAVGSFFTATGSETGTGTAYLETIEIL